MRLDLPYPHKALWPNGRPHWAAKARETKKHRTWAWGAAMEQRDKLRLGDGKLAIRITVLGKPNGPLPDEDGVSASAKAYLDGIADAIGLNDRNFAAPTVAFGDRRASRFIVEVGL